MKRFLFEAPRLKPTMPENTSRSSCPGWRARRSATAAAVLAGLAATSGHALAQQAGVDRHAERPTGHTSSGTSFMERTVTMPARGILDFEYFVDSEANRDFLQVLVDGNAQFSASGRNRRGRTALPLSAGAHQIRFAYVKGAAGGPGLDTAWVDGVRIASGGFGEQHRFDELSLQSPAGWQAGGVAGGFRVTRKAARRGIRRAAAVAMQGYNPNGVTAAEERSISWPPGGTNRTLLVSYTVDSEPDRDFFKVYVDGVEKFRASGPEASGVAKINVGGAGAHTIRLAYEKDQSVDEGLDDALVWGLEAQSDGMTFEVGGFDGASVGSTPSGWSVPAGAAAGWVIGPGRQYRLYTQPQTQDPTVDGIVEELHRQGTKTRFVDSADIIGVTGSISTLLSSTSSSLHLYGRVEGQNPAVGGESGQLTILLDAGHTFTLQGAGCGGNTLMPSTEDRRIVIDYQIAAGQQQAVTSVSQFVGTCAAPPFRAAVDNEPLPVSLAVVEPDDQSGRGFVLFEVSIGLASTGVFADGWFGLGVRAASQTGVEYHLPSSDDAPPIDEDVSSWESIRMGSISTSSKSPLNVVADGARRVDDGGT